MKIEATTLPDTEVSCLNCEACCCRLEVILITDTEVPDYYIEVDKWGGRSMARLDDGWCSAL
ncbi:MAG: YkgJ family cysteine cluster protein, partial [Gammaproteobacteria bacterium]